MDGIEYQLVYSPLNALECTNERRLNGTVAYTSENGARVDRLIKISSIETGSTDNCFLKFFLADGGMKVEQYFKMLPL